MENTENILKLSKPIMINGEERNQLKYDFENMTARDKLEVGKRLKMDGFPISVEEIDSDYHFYLFAGAVVKAENTTAKPEDAIDISDLLRLNAKDTYKGARLARNFFYQDSEAMEE